MLVAGAMCVTPWKISSGRPSELRRSWGLMDSVVTRGKISFCSGMNDTSYVVDVFRVTTNLQRIVLAWKKELAKKAADHKHHAPPSRTRKPPLLTVGAPAIAQRCYMAGWKMAEVLDSDQCAEVPCDRRDSVSAIEHSTACLMAWQPHAIEVFPWNGATLSPLSTGEWFCKSSRSLSSPRCSCSRAPNL
jgi:hypothetical protein